MEIKKENKSKLMISSLIVMIFAILSFALFTLLYILSSKFFLVEKIFFLNPYVTLVLFLLFTLSPFIASIGIILSTVCFLTKKYSQKNKKLAIFLIFLSILVIILFLFIARNIEPN